MCLFNCTEILFHSLILLIPFRQTLQVSPEIYPFISLTQNIIFVLALIHKSWRLVQVVSVHLFVSGHKI